jgi:hypothetical protein
VAPQAQGCAPPPQVAGLLSKNQWFLLEARWAGHGCDACVARAHMDVRPGLARSRTAQRNARIQHFILGSYRRVSMSIHSR